MGRAKNLTLALIPSSKDLAVRNYGARYLLIHFSTTFTIYFYLLYFCL